MADDTTIHDTDTTPIEVSLRELDDAHARMLYDDCKNGRIARRLTTEEEHIFNTAIIDACAMVPCFRHAFSVLSPYVSFTCDTACTHENGRVTLGYWFLYILDNKSRAIVMLHEIMHLLNNHFGRSETLGMSPQRMNLCGDLEINTALSTVEGAKSFFTSMHGLLPEMWDLPQYKTMEYYHANLPVQQGDNASTLVRMSDKNQGTTSQGGDGSSGVSGNEPQSDHKDQQQDQGRGSSSQGKEFPSYDEFKDMMTQGAFDSMSNTMCRKPEEGAEKEADKAGIDASSSSSITSMRSNVEADIRQEREVRSTGGMSRSGHGDVFYNLVLSMMRPPKVDWTVIFSRLFSSHFSAAVRGNTHATFRRWNRRYTHPDGIGMPTGERYLPHVVFALDTSGSMGNDDFMDIMAEANDVIQRVTRGRAPVDFINVDTDISSVKPVRRIEDVQIVGGGGTCMATAFKYANGLRGRRKPDLFILGTDGYIDWDDVIKELNRPAAQRYVSTILVTTHDGFEHRPSDIDRFAAVIDVSSE